jgi:hypothetical protein
MAVIKHLLLPLLVICCLLEFEAARASGEIAHRTFSLPTQHPMAD